MPNIKPQPLIGIVQSQQLKHRVDSFIGSASAAVTLAQQMSPRRWWRQTRWATQPATAKHRVAAITADINTPSAFTKLCMVGQKITPLMQHAVINYEQT